MLQEKEKENAPSFNVQYKRRYLNMYILFLLPSILTVIIILLIIISIIIFSSSSSSSSSSSCCSSSSLALNIVKMMCRMGSFKKSYFVFIVDICNIPFTLEFD